MKRKIKALRSFQICRGIFHHWFQPEVGNNWGGPFNGQVGRQELFSWLIRTIRPVMLLETGTYRGATTEFLAKSRLPVTTIEVNPRHYGFSCARLWRCRNVTLHLGDSRTQIRKLFRSSWNILKISPILAYLDAHWNGDLPLLEEIETIFTFCPGAVVMIDDFRVPDDPGYGFDAYGPARALTEEYVLPIIECLGLVVLYPALESKAETGARRGCVVLARNEWKKSLLSSGLLRTISTPKHALPLLS